MGHTCPACSMSKGAVHSFTALNIDFVRLQRNGRSGCTVLRGPTCTTPCVQYRAMQVGAKRQCGGEQSCNVVHGQYRTRGHPCAYMVMVLLAGVGPGLGEGGHPLLHHTHRVGSSCSSDGPRRLEVLPGAAGAGGGELRPGHQPLRGPQQRRPLFLAWENPSLPLSHY